MKKIVSLSVAFIAATGLASASALAGPAKAGGDGFFIIHNLEMMNTTADNKLNKKLRLNCSRHSNSKGIKLKLSNTTFNITKDFKLVNFKQKVTGKKNGITSFEWTATTKYTVGKKTYSKPFYGQSLQLDGSNVAVGVFNNGFCKGNFSVLKHPPTPPHKK